MKVDLIDYMGSDLTVANAARVSFDKQSDWNIVSHQKECWDDSRIVVTSPVKELKEADKKQGSYDDKFVELTFAEECQPKAVVNMCRELYNAMIDMQVCAEQARMILPQNMYTEWYWSGSLYAFARICGLRLKKDTQKETRDIADMIYKLAEKNFPVSWKALMCKE